MPRQEVPSAILNKLTEIRAIIRNHKNLRPIVLMTFLVKSHPALSPNFAVRMTMGSLLSLSPPAAVDGQFAYLVEVWQSCHDLIESGLSVSDGKKRGNFIF